MSKDYQKKKKPDIMNIDFKKLLKSFYLSMLYPVLCYQFTWLIYKKWLCPNPNHFLNSVH